jgi:pimeloyl-ACP methyl ester carboxylesterase
MTNHSPENTVQPLRVTYRDRTIHAASTGEGGPPIVLMTGLGVPASSWRELDEDLTEALTAVMETGPWGNRPLIEPALAAFTRVITYDRAGIGDSTPPEQTRDLDDFVGELEAVLQEAEVKEPALLVGHSISGLVAFEYTRRFPEQVAGLVLLDSSHPDQAVRFAVHATAAQSEAEAQQVAEMQEHHPERPDLAGLLSQGKHVTAPGTLNDLPLVVVSRGVTAFGPQQQASPHMTEAYWHRRMKVWATLQAEYVLASSQGRQMRATRSGHYPQLDEPDLMIATVRALWDEVRERSPRIS